MELIVYLGSDENGFRLHQVFEKISQEHHLDISLTIEELSHKLHQCFYTTRCLVVLKICRDEMDDFLQFSDLLRDFRTVLVLGDRSDETLTKALLLFPRFIGFVDSDIRELTSVLMRMVENH